MAKQPVNDIDSLRVQCADWYADRAAQLSEAGYGAIAHLWRKFSARILNGDADHRLGAVAASQREYDEAAS